MATTDHTGGVTLSDAGWADDVDCSAYSVLSGVAGTNTITGTGPATYSYAATRPPVWFIPAVTNTGATTINVTPSGASALGSKNVFWDGAACVGGELKAGVPAALIYDGTQFNILAHGTICAATQAQQETGAALTFAVTPGRQQYHPSSTKFWCRFDGTGAGPFTPTLDYNVVDVTDNGTGNYTVNIETDFSGATWAPGAFCNQETTTESVVPNIDGTAGAGIAAGTLILEFRRSSDFALRDVAVVTAWGWGDQ